MDRGQVQMADIQKLSLKDLSTDQLFEKLKSSTEGLSGEEVKHRLEQYGYNEIAEKKVHPFLKFLSYFWGPIPWMIIIAAILSGVLRKWDDLFIILALLGLNAVVAFREEYSAGNAVEALKKQLAVKATAKRDGKWQSIQARELVPGDIIRLRIGNIIPADAKLLDGDPVQVDQSALTGESMPVEHKPGETVYSGSILKQGEIDALVYATAQNTYFGKTTQLVKEAKTKSHLQRAVLEIANYLIFIAIGLAALILTVAFFRHDSIPQVLQFALILTVASVPVAMPAVLSVTMALGSHALAVKKAIVTKLVAIEEVASIDMLCADKTGTLTQNKLTPGEPFVVEGGDVEELELVAALASRAEDQDPIDLAVLRGLKDENMLRAFRIEHFQPFDPVQKRTEAKVADGSGKIFRATKGAPQVILALDPKASKIQKDVEQAVGEFAARGFRSLGVARADEGGDWRFLGVIPLHDPLREDSMDTVKTAMDMGIAIKMVTGDQIAIAKEIAKQLHLGTNIVDASLFSETKHHESGQAADAIEQADGFAQVFPEHKYHIVDVLQQRGHIVGMTGDGVNDAPALKKADAGIAVEGSTDAARAAASIVLTAPGISVIIDAIKESRKIFRRMLNYAIYRIAETIRVLLLMTLSILVFNFYPVTAVMIVLLALLNDGAILSIAYDRAAGSHRPEAWNMRHVLGLATVLGIMGVVASFGLFYLGEHVFHLSRDLIQTLIYLKLSVAGHMTIFITRTRGPFWSYRPSWILLGAVVGTQVIATLIAVYGLFMTPLGWTWAAFVWGYALIWFLVNDGVKLATLRLFEQPEVEAEERFYHPSTIFQLHQTR